MSEKFLVTGSMGCIGAWTLYHLLQQGQEVVSFDVSEGRHRLDLLLSAEEQAAIAFVKGDLTDYAQVKAAIDRHGITRIIHLAALQVPFCIANPILGASVNVTGTVNVFEAARQSGISHLTYASSIAVYGPPDNYAAGLVPHDAPHDPRTLYGVYKRANEGTARIYWQDWGVSSTALRPYTVYGVGRDQGLTSEPSQALQAVAKGKPYDISFGGTMQFQLASDVAQQFILASLEEPSGAHVFNLGTEPASVAQFAEIVRSLRPHAQLTVGERELPFPRGFDDRELLRHATIIYETPLYMGIKETIEDFERMSDG